MEIEREDVEGSKDSEMGRGTRTGPDEADKLVVVACLGSTRTVHVGEQRQWHRVPACAATSKAAKYARPRLRSLVEPWKLGVCYIEAESLFVTFIFQGTNRPWAKPGMPTGPSRLGHNGPSAAPKARIVMHGRGPHSTNVSRVL